MRDESHLRHVDDLGQQVRCLGPRSVRRRQMVRDARCARADHDRAHLAPPRFVAVLRSQLLGAQSSERRRGFEFEGHALLRGLELGTQFRQRRAEVRMLLGCLGELRVHLRERESRARGLLCLAADFPLRRLQLFDARAQHGLRLLQALLVRFVREQQRSHCFESRARHAAVGDEVLHAALRSTPIRRFEFVEHVALRDLLHRRDLDLDPAGDRRAVFLSTLRKQFESTRQPQRRRNAATFDRRELDAEVRAHERRRRDAIGRGFRGLARVVVGVVLRCLLASRERAQREGREPQRTCRAAMEAGGAVVGRVLGSLRHRDSSRGDAASAAFGSQSSGQ